ncbi:MAG TPA: hypothetical protein VFL63_03440, partial [Rhodanobacteraceae bacterium]|nr:hypothetical protein [Rhodanobacteraceae bacterium]
MALHQTGDEKERCDAADDPRGPPRTGLAPGELGVREIRFRRFRTDCFVCSKHVLVESQAMDGRDGVAIADDCSPHLRRYRRDQGRSHKSMTDIAMRQLAVVDHRRHREAVVRRG